MQHIDVAVIGAGVVGLAAAAEIAGRGRATCVLERHPRPGMESSTHNSGVIHAGLYHPPDSLKTRLALEGRALLYEFCERHHVPYRRSGKLVVTSAEEHLPALEALFRNARTNGVTDVEMLDGAAVARLEPAIKAHAAIHSPSTGLIEPESFIRTLRDLCIDRDVALLMGTPLVSSAADGRGITLRTPREEIRASLVVNTAGLFADEISEMCGGDAFRIYPCRGEYVELVARRSQLVSRPIYPLPEASGHGLGVHLTPTVGGALLLGPTARYQTDKRDYEGNRLPVEAFLEPARQLVPQLSLADLRPGGSGIRPKLHPPEFSFADFHIARDTRVPELVHAAGIDSPGLTACLAIARMVADILDDRG